MTVSTRTCSTPSVASPAAGVRVEALVRRGGSRASGETDAEGRIRRGSPSAAAGTYRLVFFPPLALLPAGRGLAELASLSDGHHHIPLLLSSYACARATAEAERRGGTAGLFEAAARTSSSGWPKNSPTRSDVPAGACAAGSPTRRRRSCSTAHPAIGAADGLSARSSSRAGHRQRARRLDEAQPSRAYEERFGFRFVVFVGNRRPKREGSSRCCGRGLRAPASRRLATAIGRELDLDRRGQMAAFLALERLLVELG